MQSGDRTAVKKKSDEGAVKEDGSFDLSVQKDTTTLDVFLDMDYCSPPHRGSGGLKIKNILMLCGKIRFSFGGFSCSFWGLAAHFFSWGSRGVFNSHFSKFSSLSSGKSQALPASL